MRMAWVAENILKMVAKKHYSPLSFLKMRIHIPIINKAYAF